MATSTGPDRRIMEIAIFVSVPVDEKNHLLDAIDDIGPTFGADVHGFEVWSPPEQPPTQDEIIETDRWGL